MSLTFIFQYSRNIAKNFFYSHNTFISGLLLAPHIFFKAEIVTVIFKKYFNKYLMVKNFIPKYDF